MTMTHDAPPAPPTGRRGHRSGAPGGRPDRGVPARPRGEAGGARGILALIARLRRTVGPVAAAVRPLGWVALVGAIGGYIGARVTGWRELAVLAVGLAALLVIAAVSAVGRAHYHVEVDLRSRRVVVGEQATGRIAVTNTAKRRLLPARIELPVGIATASFPLPGMAVDEIHEESFLVPTQRRAVIPVGPARSVRGDAFGLIRRVVKWTEPDVIYVHPRTVQPGGVASGFLKDLEGQATRELSNDDVSFHGLRTYVPGDDWRYIHWKTSARSLATPAQTLMVRQFEETHRSHLAVTVSTRAGEYRTDNEFELAVSCAASIGVQAFRESWQLSMASSAGALPAVTVPRMLDAFSGLDTADGAENLVAVARSAATRAPGVSVAFVVCGSIPAPREIRAAALAFPVGVRTVAIRAVDGAATALSRIGSTTVVTVGVLGDLPRVLRQAATAR